MGRALVRVRTDAFEASFLPSPVEGLEAACNVDADRVMDGSLWSATVVPSSRSSV